MEEKAVAVLIDFSREKSENMILDDDFKDILTQRFQYGIQFGNLSYRRHVADLQHKKAICNLEFTTKRMN